MKTRPEVKIICDLQFGSTGKGLIAGYLAKRDQPDVLVTAWMPNAGHTYVDTNGRKYVHTMLANGIVSPRLQYVLIGPGSVVNLENLVQEIIDADLPAHVQVLIHPSAALVSERHRLQESIGSMVAIGSTRKGSGAALMEKLSRDTSQSITADQQRARVEAYAVQRGVMNLAVTSHSDYETVLCNACKIQLEGAQGFSLGINSGFWPHTTSRECTPAQMASDCLIPLSWVVGVIGTLRTYPIRVANRYNAFGEMVGYSGPIYPDQREVTWEEIGQETELTTVTKLPRRVFTFSWDQLGQAMHRVEPTQLFLNFANYLGPQELYDMRRKINRVAADHDCGRVRYIGHGPSDKDIVDIGTGFAEDYW